MAGMAFLFFTGATLARRQLTSPVSQLHVCAVPVSTLSTVFCPVLFVTVVSMQTSDVCLSIRLWSNFGESCEEDSLPHVLNYDFGRTC